MASLNVDELYKKYEGFYYPISRVLIGGKNPEEEKKMYLKVVDFNVELTSDLKASIATFSILNGYDMGSGAFMSEKLKKYIAMGTDVTVYLGHAADLTEVFKGFIAGVDFVYNKEEPSESLITITALDVKGIMMANSYSKRLKANYYSDAVKELLDQSPYETLKKNGVITSVTISDTPDKPQAGAVAGGAGGEKPDIRIEMVAESDYEFVVKAAKKFNFEFFSIGGNVVFRKAKQNTQPLLEMGPNSLILSYDIGYDITGVVGQVVVRTMDIGKGNKIEVKKKNQNKVSLGSKAKPIISSQSYIYVDSAIESQKDAESRAEYILENMSYKLGHLRMVTKGLPELVPGRFITLKNFGSGISNKYYITDVTHSFQGADQYITIIEGKAATL